MDNRTNTIAGWTLAAFGAALGLSIVGGMVMKSEAPPKEGFPLEAPADGADSGSATPDVPIATMLASADPAKGAEVFKKCAACHTVDQGAPNGIGPNLYATVGEGVAEGKGGFAFSDALKAHGGKWDFDSLNAWLTNPRKFASGTKMTFAGLPDEKDRANVIVYLNSMGSKLPLPAAPAAAPAGAAPAAGAPTGTGTAPGAATTSGTGPAEKAGTSGGKAAPGAPALSNAATPASGAPSQDPAAARAAAKGGK
ncbi:MAG: cytochrome c family protein [Sphingomonas sp.]